MLPSLVIECHWFCSCWIVSFSLLCLRCWILLTRHFYSCNDLRSLCCRLVRIFGSRSSPSICVWSRCSTEPATWHDTKWFTCNTINSIKKTQRELKENAKSQRLRDSVQFSPPGRLLWSYRPKEVEAQPLDVNSTWILHGATELQSATLMRRQIIFWNCFRLSIHVA